MGSTSYYLVFTQISATNSIVDIIGPGVWTYHRNDLLQETATDNEQHHHRINDKYSEYSKHNDHNDHNDQRLG